MSLDYSKYGYKEYKGHYTELEYTQARVSNEILIWENKDLNYFKAYEIFFKMISVRNDTNNNFTLAPWDLAMIGLAGDVSERLKLHNSYIKNAEIDSIRSQFVKNYKQQKLNYV